MVIASDNLNLWKKYKNQILATVAVNLIAFSHGHSTGWLAPTLPLLQSEGSPLDTGPISVEEASWIGAIVCVGGLIGNNLYGVLINKIGLKKSLYLLVIPHASFWIIVIFGTDVSHLYIGRALSGIAGGGAFVVIPTFISDIADSRIRGTLGAMLITNFNAGILSGFILGSYLSYFLFPRVVIGFCLVFLVAIYPLPDTPQYFLRIKKDDEAERALQFYRNFQAETKEECQEFNEYFANLKNSIQGSAENIPTKLSYRDFLKPAAVRGILAGVGLVFLYQFSGLFALINYTANIFKMSGSTMDANTCTIIVGAIQLAGTLLATNFVDRAGRRPLLIISCAGVAVSSFALSVFSYLNSTQDMSHLSWIALISVSMAILLGSFGLTPLPFVVITEIMPQKIKDVAIPFCLSSLTILGFIVLKIYPVLMINLGLHGVMWISGGITAIGGVLIYFFLPETKGKILGMSEEDS